MVVLNAVNTEFSRPKHEQMSYGGSYEHSTTHNEFFISIDPLLYICAL